MTQKVFCIGLSKTGSSSLAKALEYMGFHVGRRKVIFKRHFPQLDLLEAIDSKNHDAIFKIIPFFDAFVDNPWPLLYKELAKEYPDAKFILTTREEGAWLQSVKTYFGNSRSDFRRLSFGHESPIGHEEAYLAAYRKHNQEVQAFFKEMPQKLLVLSLESDQKWKLLSEFLKVDAPNLDYPIVNRTNTYSSKPKPWRAFLDFTYYEVLITLLYARILTLFFPFKKTANKMASSICKKEEFRTKSEIVGEAIQLSQVVRSVSKKVPFRTKCFEQALSLQILLKRKNISSDIVFGLHSKEDKLAAHAWCVCQGVTLSGEKGKEQFQIIKSFTNSIM